MSVPGEQLWVADWMQKMLDLHERTQKPLVSFSPRVKPCLPRKTFQIRIYVVENFSETNTTAGSIIDYSKSGRLSKFYGAVDIDRLLKQAFPIIESR